MNGKSAIMLVLAVCCGLGAMYGSKQLLSKNTVPVVPKQNVVVAARALKADEVLKEDMLKLVPMPEDRVPAGSFTAVKDLLGRFVQIPILADEAVVDPKLGPIGAAPGLVAQIPKGMRAFAVEVNEQSGVSGFILHGHRVDVVQTHMDQGASRLDARTILEDVLVLASGQVFTRTEDKSILSRTVTLALKPDQVEKVVAAKTQGPISLALRGLDDHETRPIAEVAEAEPEPEPEPIPPPPPPVVPEPAPAPAPAPVPAPRRRLTIHHGMYAVEHHQVEAPRVDP